MALGRSVTRRAFLASAAATALASCGPTAASQSSASATPLPAPETTKLRIGRTLVCDPWRWLSESYLRGEGFTDIQYGSGIARDGTADMSTVYASAHVTNVDSGHPVVTVAGAHTGCIELFARPGLDTIADLRGKRIAVNAMTTDDLAYVFIASLFAHVGMKPSDANFVAIGDASVPAYFVDGKADAILTFAAQGPLLKANPKNPGRVILSSAFDKPWSQNYCCVITANRDWARTNPVAVKRATRGILRAIDEGKRDLRAAATLGIEKRMFSDTPQVTEQVLYDVIHHCSYDWRDYDAEETVRFFALRLADAKLIKKSPQQITAEGTDLAWFRQLRKELKA